MAACNELRMGNLKLAALLWFAMGALQCGMSEEVDLVEGSCNDVIRLPCKATVKTTKYRYVMWYKSKIIPIIKKKGESLTIYNHSFTLGQNESLEIRNARPSDSGEYKCYLAAVVGGLNDESFIQLNVSECLHVSTVYPSTMISTYSSLDPEEKTVFWPVLGFTLLSLAKIIISIVTVGMCDRVIFRTERRQREISRNKSGTKSSWKKSQTS